MLDILTRCYKFVFLWPQGVKDEEYFQMLKLNPQIEILSFGLSSYDRILEMDSIDYVGTRLHAGIRALSKCHRTIVISIDNRADNFGKTPGYP